MNQFLMLFPVIYSSCPLWLLIPSTVINGFTGGGIVILMSGFSMITDLSRGSTGMTIRIAVGSACFTFGMVIGSLLTGEILSRTNNSYTLVFLGMEIFACISFFYGVLVVYETVDLNAVAEQRQTVREKSSCVTDGVQKLKEAVGVILRSREGHRRAYLAIGLVIFSVIISGDIGMFIHNFTEMLGGLKYSSKRLRLGVFWK